MVPSSLTGMKSILPSCFSAGVYNDRAYGRRKIESLFDVACDYYIMFERLGKSNYGGAHAEGGSRTLKRSPSHDFESCASASSATSAKLWH